MLPSPQQKKIVWRNSLEKHHLKKKISGNLKIMIDIKKRKNIQKGSWSPQCFYDRKRTALEKMQKIAESKGGKCLSKDYINFRSILEFECEKGHRWEASPDNILRGSWCSECRHNKIQKSKIEEMQKLANLKGGKCLSEKYINCKSKIEWECKEGHRWEASPDNIQHRSWCPECKRGKKFEEIQKIAESKGGKCLSKDYINFRSILEFECKEGHRWLTTPENIRHGAWCQECKNELRKQWKEKKRELVKRFDLAQIKKSKRINK